MTDHSMIPIKKTHILIVDDYPANIQALSALIASDDIEVHTFMGVDEALVALTKYDFALALLDVQMPEMSGFELAKLIRGVIRCANLPIIFVTAEINNERTVLQGYETGAVDILFKPLDPYIVQGKVRVFVKLHQQKILLEEQLKELKILRTAADAANIAKSYFLANMSHEIRTPLSAVMGFSNLIVKGEMPQEEFATCALSIQRNGQLLMRLVDDILDLAKIEANHLLMDEEEDSIFECLNDVEETLREKAHQKKIELRIEVAPKVESKHVFDPIRMKQILLNIIGNAIKFTKEGEVNVFVKTEETSPHEDSLIIKVKDQGIGISPDDIDHLFHPFSQANTSVTREFGGTGLGLVIARKLAQVMGGDIRLISTEIGVGSVIEIRVQLKKGVIPKKSKPPMESYIYPENSLLFEGKKFLIVDDAKDNLVLVEMFLRKTGAIITNAFNGLEAVELAKSLQFDLILMDIQMPKMNGHEATKKIRVFNTHVPIIALTAFASSEENKKCLSSGYSQVITKPLAQDKLLKMIHDYVM